MTAGDEIDDMAARLLARGWANARTEPDPDLTEAERALASRMAAGEPARAPTGLLYRWHWRNSDRGRQWVITLNGEQVWLGYGLDTLRDRSALIRRRGDRLERGKDDLQRGGAE